MRIIIIGGNSFLGKSIRKKWEDQFEIHSLSRNEYEFPSRAFQSGFNWELLKEADVIIHCVAAGVQRDHKIAVSELNQVNCYEPIHLIQTLSSKGFEGKLITFGSYFSMGNIEGIATESDFFKCANRLDNDYSMSKFLFSCYSNRANYPIDHTHLILSNIIGPLEHSNRLLPYIHFNVQRGKRMSFSHGRQVRQFTFVNDLIQALELVIGSTSNGVFHFTNPDINIVNEVVRQALDVFGNYYGVTPEYAFGARQIKDAGMDRLAIDPTEFFDTFGKVQFTSLKRAFSSYLKND